MQVGFGGDEAAFAGGFEDAGAVALEVGLHALEGGDAGVEAGELGFEFGDDAALFVWFRNLNLEWRNLIEVDRGAVPRVQVRRKTNEVARIQAIAQKVRINAFGFR